MKGRDRKSGGKNKKNRDEKRWREEKGQGGGEGEEAAGESEKVLQGKDSLLLGSALLATPHQVAGFRVNSGYENRVSMARC